MARLPPKLPANMSSAVSQAWSSYPYHHQLPRPPSMPSFFPSFPTPSPEATSNPSWVDDFFDFSSTKRGAHRRIVSDSITFFDSYPVEAVDSCAAPISSSSDFDHLDDENLIAISSNDVPPQPPSEHPPTTPSTPSDHNSNSDQDKQTHCRHSEAQSDCNADPPNPMAGMEPVRTPAPETSPPIADPKRVRRYTSTTLLKNGRPGRLNTSQISRILANRQSAQRSRVRKLQYISELEKNVTTLQMEVSALSPRVACLDHQRSVLNIGNNHLRQRIAALAQDQIFKDARQDALQNEIERLRHVYTQQNLKKVVDSAGASTEITVVADMELNLPACIDHDSSSEC